MSNSFERETSHHPQHQNVHGAEGCVTKDGKACTACCHFFEVKPLQKPKQTACVHLCNGCGIHNQPQQPEICRDYHCSRESEVLKNPLIADSVIRRMAFERVVGLLETALMLEEITMEEYQLSHSYWLGLKESVYVFDEG